MTQLYVITKNYMFFYQYYCYVHMYREHVKKVYSDDVRDCLILKQHICVCIYIYIYTYIDTHIYCWKFVTSGKLIYFYILFGIFFLKNYRKTIIDIPNSKHESYFKCYYVIHVITLKDLRIFYNFQYPEATKLFEKKAHTAELDDLHASPDNKHVGFYPHNWKVTFSNLLLGNEYTCKYIVCTGEDF